MGVYEIKIVLTTIAAMIILPLLGAIIVVKINSMRRHKARRKIFAKRDAIRQLIIIAAQSERVAQEQKLDHEQRFFAFLNQFLRKVLEANPEPDYEEAIKQAGDIF